MRIRFIALLFGLGILITDCYGQTDNPAYDSDLAQKLNADAYGMKSYVLVILKSGSNPVTDQEVVKQSFRGHLDNITRLVESGEMIVAGPLGQNQNRYRGIFILNVADTTSARKLLESDPAVANGLLDADLFSWYGSAALPTYLDFADKIWKQKP